MRHCARLAVNGLELSWSVNNILSATVDLEWAQRGKLVLEEDFHGYEREDRHEPQTVTKSVTSFLAGMLALTICGLGCYDGAAERAPVAEAAAGQRGGRLVVALRAEPRTLNPVLAVDRPSLAVIRRTIGDLIHINRHSHETEPGLAESWEVSPDGRVYTVELRRGVSFSDGHPFDADDVVFSLAVLQDEAVGAPQRSLLVVDGRTVEVRKLGSHTVEFELSAPVAAGARLFDSLAMLPRHLLGEAYARGEIDEMWGIGTPPEGIAGLGPFRLKSHTPGQQLVLAHNPHYWKTDAEGTRLPYLDEIVFLFVPSEDAQAARFASGEIDVVDSLSAGNYAVLEADREQRGYALHDLGPGMAFDFLFFNLNPLQAEELPNVAARQKWFRKRGFRQAVSAAVDREAISRLVYQGRAVPIWSSVSPGNRRWFNDAVPHPPRSLERAKELLRSEGFSWREGRLVDAAGDPVGFTIVTNSTNQKRVEMMTIIQQDLIELGMDVRVAGLEFRALIERILSSHEYDVAILALGGGDADPSSMMNVLLSSGGSHLWSPAQSSPATPWEAEIDRLMNEQATTLDYAERAAKYDRVQEIIAEQLPLVPLVSPNVLTGASSDLGNMRPAVLEHYTLWNSEELFWKRPAAR